MSKQHKETYSLISKALYNKDGTMSKHVNNISHIAPVNRVGNLLSNIFSQNDLFIHLRHYLTTFCCIF